MCQLALTACSYFAACVCEKNAKNEDIQDDVGNTNNSKAVPQHSLFFSAA